MRAAGAARAALAYDASFIVLLGALTMLPPLSIDVSLPGLPAIARALGASNGAMQQTLSVFVFAFGAGQLVLGPFSDRYGRRPVLIAGLVVFTLAGIACTVATSAPVLVIWRFVQGLGACAGTMSARAIVQDIAPDRARATTLQAYVTAVTSIAPIVAPLLGAAILVTLGWRSLYGVLALAGAILIPLVLARLPETAPGTSENAFAAYGRVLRLPRTVPLALVVGCAFGAYFALISGSPFALIAQLHVGSTLYAACFAINACALLAGAFVTGRLAARIGTERLFAIAIALNVVVAAILCALDVFAPTPVGFVATFAAFAFTMGIVSPSAFAAGLAEAGPDAGKTAALLGATQMIGGAACSAIAVTLLPVPSAGIGLTVFGASLAATAAYVASARQGRRDTDQRS